MVEAAGTGPDADTERPRTREDWPEFASRVSGKAVPCSKTATPWRN